MFHSADKNEIKAGEITDAYFPRTLEVLKAKGIDKRVKAEFIPDFAVGFVARRSKPRRNAQLERFVAKRQPVFKFVISLHAFRHSAGVTQA